MAKTIWKYACPVEDVFELEIPKHHKILSFQCQKDKPCIWVLVDPDTPKVKKRFQIFGTGHPITGWIGNYIGTAQQFNGSLVWHLFEY
jgi:hypothetical protein